MEIQTISSERDVMKDKEIIEVRSEDETRILAEKLASEVAGGTVIALEGELGAGKTTFTKYFAQALGIDEMIQSPTFTVVRSYDEGKFSLHHFDVYRVHDEEELFEIGFFEYIESSDGVCLIEWANLVKDLLPTDAWSIHIGYGERENERIFEILR